MLTSWWVLNIPMKATGGLTPTELMRRGSWPSPVTAPGPSPEFLRERIAGLLLQLRTSYGHDVAAGGVRLDMALSRENLAQMVGTTKESAVRVLSDFRQEQLIEDSRRKMVLLSPHRLVEVAGFID